MTQERVSAAQVQPQVTARLSTLAADDKLPGSLLFVGPKGVGKWVVANELAKILTCEQSRDGFCGRCHSCRQADSFSHPDILYLFPMPKEKWEPLYHPYLEAKAANPFAAGSDDVTSFITIDSIRHFESKLAHKASLSHYKVGIIYEAERMLPAAMDALLKTLEEPSPGSFLIVVTDQPRFLPQTIISRLMRVNFQQLSEDFVAEYLRSHFEIDDTKGHLLAHFASGNLYRADLLIEGDYLETKANAYSAFEDSLSLPVEQFHAKHSGSSALDSREKVERLLVHWQAFVRDLAVLRMSQSDAGSPVIEQELMYPDLLDGYSKCQEKIDSLDQILTGNEYLERVRSELRRNITPRMAAFSFLLGFSGRVWMGRETH